MFIWTVSDIVSLGALAFCMLFFGFFYARAAISNWIQQRKSKSSAMTNNFTRMNRLRRRDAIIQDFLGFLIKLCIFIGLAAFAWSVFLMISQGAG